jgi:hypothetical protein
MICFGIVGMASTICKSMRPIVWVSLYTGMITDKTVPASEGEGFILPHDVVSFWPELRSRARPFEDGSEEPSGPMGENPRRHERNRKQ